MLEPKRIQQVVCQGADIFGMLPEAYRVCSVNYFQCFAPLTAMNLVEGPFHSNEQRPVSSFLSLLAFRLIRTFLVPRPLFISRHISCGIVNASNSSFPGDVCVSRNQSSHRVFGPHGEINCTICRSRPDIPVWGDWRCQDLMLILHQLARDYAGNTRPWRLFISALVRHTDYISQ